MLPNSMYTMVFPLCRMQVLLRFIFLFGALSVHAGQEYHYDPLDAGGRRHRKNPGKAQVQNNLVTPSSPSFLYILVDDIGWADFSYQNGTASTPNIDAWARQKGSIRLKDFHSGGTVCSPTRASVLTGRHPFRDCVDTVYGCSDMTNCVPNFEFRPSNTFTVGGAIRAAGDEYKDGAFFAGKWHLGSFYNDSEAYGGIRSCPITHDFDHFNATVASAPTATANCECNTDWIKTCNYGHYGDTNNCSPQKKKHCCFNYWWDDALAPHGVANLTWPTPDDDSLYLADSFTRFLDSRTSQGKPFFAQISFSQCHIPFIGTKEAKDACARGETCRMPGPGEPPYTEMELDYYACLTQLDNAVGLVLDAVKESGYYDNTMIWLSSDNGPEKNCPPNGFCKLADTRPHRPKEGPGSAGPLRGRKRDIYEGGHRVPGIVSFPAMIQDNRESWETVVTTDFLPTVMELLNVKRPRKQRDWALDGRSIVPLLKDKRFRWQYTKKGPRRFGIAFYDWRDGTVDWGFRLGNWKLVVGSRSCTRARKCKRPQWFDLDVDLGERTNLARKYPQILKLLLEEFYKWRESVMRSRYDESECRNPLNILKGESQHATAPKSLWSITSPTEERQSQKHISDRD